MNPGREVAVLGAPSSIGMSLYRDGRPRRLDLAPGALRAAGLVERLGAVDLGDVPPGVPYRDLEKPAGRIRNASDVIAYSGKLAERVAAATSEGRFVVLMGGDCSIMLGALAGVRQRGEDVGLAYVDGHADFGTLDTSPSGSACSMNLALAVGHAEPGASLRLSAEVPLVRPELAAHIGRRDLDDPDYGSAALPRSGIADFPAELVRARGPEAVLRGALERLAAAPGGFWVHFDVDVLDPRVVPAVDSPLPDGFSPDELLALLGPLVRHPSARGLEVTIYDPELDPDAHSAGVIVEVLSALLTP